MHALLRMRPLCHRSGDPQLSLQRTVEPPTISLDTLEETTHLMQALRLREEYHADTSAEALFGWGPPIGSRLICK